VTVARISGTAQSIAVGEFHSCVIAAGIVQCWGRNFLGQTGIGSASTSVTTPTAVSTTLSGVQAIAAGAFHTCAIYSGQVYCWGYNSSYQLGYYNSSGTTNYETAPSSLYPVSMSNPLKTSSNTSSALIATALTAGAYHTCAIVRGGAGSSTSNITSTGSWVECWGYNGFGQLGNCTTTNSIQTQIVSPAYSACANGSTSATLLQGASQIAAGNNHTCAIVSGSIQCWGYNYNGQLGNNSTTNSSFATSMIGSSGGSSLMSGVQDLIAGGYFTCGLLNGGVQCTGLNSSGELGNNSTSNSLMPVNVIGF
jgi:alpha-tubulin suppressor-like RCC1 family protein